MRHGPRSVESYRWDRQRRLKDMHSSLGRGRRSPSIGPYISFLRRASINRNSSTPHKGLGRFFSTYCFALRYPIPIQSRQTVVACCRTLATSPRNIPARRKRTNIINKMYGAVFLICFRVCRYLSYRRCSRSIWPVRLRRGSRAI